MKSQAPEPENLARKHGLLASRDQNVAFETQGRRVWFRENRWKFLAALGVAIVMPCLLGSLLYQSLSRLKTLQSPAKYARAYVVSKNFIPPSKGVPGSYYVTFRLDNRIISGDAPAFSTWDRTQPDTTVPVTYHVGENGEILISDWQTSPAKLTGTQN